MAAADPGVHLVEDEHRRLVGRRQHHLERQRQPARLPAGRDAGQRTRRLAGVRREGEGDAIAAGRPDLHLLQAPRRRRRPAGPAAAAQRSRGPARRVGGRSPRLAQRGGPAVSSSPRRRGSSARSRSRVASWSSSRASSSAADVAEGDHRLERLPVLALQVVEQRQALLGGRPAGRIEVDPLPQLGGVARQLGRLRLQRRWRGLSSSREALVVRRRPRQLAARCAQRVERAGLVAQGADGACPRRARSPPRWRRPAAAAPAPRPRRAAAPAAAISSAWCRSSSTRRASSCASVSISAASRHRRAPGAVRVRPAATTLLQLPEAVEQGQLPVGGQQALLLVLAVDLGQPLPERGEAAHRHAAVVDAHQRAAIGADLAAHDRHPVAGGQHVGQRIIVEQPPPRRRPPRPGRHRSPMRTWSVAARAPSASASASTTSDLPAPVSPVSTVKPREIGSRTRSMTARFSTVSSVSDIGPSAAAQYGSREALVRSRS